MFQALFWWLARWALRLRYRVRITGLEEFRRLDGPLLVMPNHPAYIAPPLLLSHLRSHQPVRPVVIAGMYRNPALYPLMRLVNALEVPDLVEHSRDAQQRTFTMINTVVAGLQRGESFLIYPSGRVQQGNVEDLGASRAAAEILQRCPQVKVVLVRTRGLWGSMFGYAATGHRPGVGAKTGDSGDGVHRAPARRRGHGRGRVAELVSRRGGRGTPGGGQGDVDGAGRAGRGGGRARSGRGAGATPKSGSATSAFRTAMAKPKRKFPGATGATIMWTGHQAPPRCARRSSAPTAAPSARQCAAASRNRGTSSGCTRRMKLEPTASPTGYPRTASTSRLT